MLDWSLLVFFGFVVCAAFSGAIFPPGAWYETLNKPSWTPPNWLFAPAWSLLYIGIAVAGWLVWTAETNETISSERVDLAMAFWGAQLFFNAAWSGLFFGLKRMDIAFYETIPFWLSIVGFIVVAWPISVWAATLFIVYLIWVTFASVLNFAMWRYNPNGTSTAAPAKSTGR